MNGFDIEILYSDKAKGTTLEVWPGNVVKVIAPVGVSESELQKVVSTKTKWIIEKQRLIKDIPAWRDREFVSGESFPLLGREYRLKVIEGYGETVLKDDRLIVPVTQIDLEAEDKGELVKLSLMSWYQKIALDKIKDRVKFYSEAIEEEPQSISIKDYVGRWGSCTPSKDLIFNWQCITLPKKLFEYVIAHEVAHLIELNHSKEFYRKLSLLGFENDELVVQLKYYRNIF